MELIAVSGISGSGKSSALHALEDAGYYCVDNLPPALLCELARELASGPEPTGRAAVGIDVRTRTHLEDLPDQLRQLHDEGVADVRGLFLESNEECLLRRFSETRRRHPLADGERSLREAIALERQYLAPLAEAAGYVLDTSSLSIHELRRTVQAFAERGASPEAMTLLFQSFGFKNGVPMDSDLLFDLRFLPNPNYEPELRPRTGLDAEVAAFLDEQTPLAEWLAEVQSHLGHWLPAYAREPRGYLTVSIGCTGGRHRSVLAAERLGSHFRGHHGPVLVRHRDLDSTT